MKSYQRQLQTGDQNRFAYLSVGWAATFAAFLAIILTIFAPAFAAAFKF